MRSADKIITQSNAHIKREVTFGNDWPRLIAARHDGLRAISAVLYDVMADQLFDNEWYIKHMNQTEVIKQCMEKVLGQEYLFCLDMSSYDASQRGLMWELEA